MGDITPIYPNPTSPPLPFLPMHFPYQSFKLHFKTINYVFHFLHVISVFFKLNVVDYPGTTLTPFSSVLLLYIYIFLLLFHWQFSFVGILGKAYTHPLFETAEEWSVSGVVRYICICITRQSLLSTLRAAYTHYLLSRPIKTRSHFTAFPLTAIQQLNNNMGSDSCHYLMVNTCPITTLYLHL